MSTILDGKPIKLMAVASGGGHLIQLLRLRPAFAGCEVTYVSTVQPPGLHANDRVIVVQDANLNEKRKLARLFIQTLLVIIKNRPQVIITTGAAPGFAAIVIGRLFGAKTIWIDSIANSEELSASGQKAKYWADLWLTQWSQLGHDDGPKYWGAVL